jgi:hypothetical protein
MLERVNSPRKPDAAVGFHVKENRMKKVLFLALAVITSTAWLQAQYSQSQ